MIAREIMKQVRVLILSTLVAASVWGAQESTPAARFEQALRPPSLKHVDVTMWPYFRPLPEQASPEGLRLLQEVARKPEDLGLQTPLERAFLQGKVWSFFDAQVRSWTWIDPKTVDAREERTPLTKPAQAKPGTSLEAAARLMRALALRDDERAALPDPYARTVESKMYPDRFDPARPLEPFLPADLWEVDGPWIHLGNSKDFPLANRHVTYFGGRSVFHLFLRVPEGRAAGLALLEKIGGYDGLKYQDGPPLPAGTQVALVEKAFVVAPDGALVATPLAEVVELRVHLRPERRFEHDKENPVQAVHRFRLRHDLLLQGDPAPLRSLVHREEDWEPVLQLVEHARAGPWTARGASIGMCRSCHLRPGVNGLGIFEMRTTFKGKAGDLMAAAPTEEVARTLRWKEQDLTGKELRALWKP